MDAAASKYPAATPHGGIERIGDDVFMVRGCVQMRPLFRVTRNMGIVREGNELTLVDPIRLDAATEGAMLGRLGRDSQHRATRRDARSRRSLLRRNVHGARLWSQAGGTKYREPPIAMWS